MSEYQHKALQKIHELYEEHNAEMGKGISFMSIMWKSISPSIPDMLKVIDEDEELFGRIRAFLETIMEAMQEDAGD